MKKNILYVVAVIITIFSFSGSLSLQAQIVDYDGNTYNAIVIGNQTWMRENLKVTHFRDGTPIPNITTPNSAWTTATVAAYCWYNNNETYKNIYGALYNWQSVSNDNLCPTGFHVPTNDEWTILVTFLGGELIAGGKLKETGTTHWLTPNTGATNQSGFTALPGGTRMYEDGTFASLGGGGLWWTSTIYLTGSYYWGIQYDEAIIHNPIANQRFGMSVRCLRNMGPYLTTDPITSITQTSAQSGGNITGDGGMPVTARGICWNTSPNPTTFNNHTNDGSGIGSFISNMTGLTPNTTYYVRAYATNSVGTSYGDEVILNTLTCPPITATITGTTAICQNSTSPNITFTGSNGTAPYTFTYNINGGSNLTISTTSGNSINLTVSTVTVGTFTYNLLSVFDIIGSACLQTQSGSAVVTVNPLPTAPIVGTITQPTCAVATGSVVLNGLPEGSWTINPGAIVGSTTSITVPNLTAGTHNYTVTNAVGCTSVASADVIIDPQPETPAAPAVGAITQPTCAVATGSVVLNGLPEGNWTINPGAIVGSTTSITVPDLTAGTHNYTVTNAVGCTSVASADVIIDPQPETPAAPAVGAITQPTCALATGSVVLSDLPADDWIINPGDIAGSGTSFTVVNLDEGTYNFTVTNKAGCSSPTSANVVIDPQPAIPTATASNNGPIIEGSSLILTGGPDGLAAYEWIGPNDFSSDEQSPIVSSNATTTMAGVYTLTVTNSNGCQGVTTTVVLSNSYMVINANDNGPGSLRNVLEYANSTIGVKETITFNIPGQGPFEIQPLTQLPAITDPVVIDGYTQPGAMPATDSEVAEILIEIVGNVSDETTGLIIEAGNSTISGLSIKNFRWNLTLAENDNNTIKGNYFTGMNGTRENIVITSSDNEIGGRSPAARNVITRAEAGNGIIIDNTEGNAARNRIIGNYIGVDPTGELKEPNDFSGITIVDSPDNIIGGQTEGDRNIVSGNNSGISISGTEATGNRIEGNYIGTNAGGTKGLGNDFGAISIGAPGNFIGGSSPGAGNVISGNGYGCIGLNSNAVGNVIQGNLIGTDRTGFNSIPNHFGEAISITGGKNNLIGGLVQSARNIISGNGENAVRIEGTEGNEAEGNKIQGNYIGTDISGKGELGNGNNGIVFGNFANNNLIGGTEPGAGNVIAFNEGAGVTVGGAGDPGTGNSIFNNSIHSNGSLGIDLAGGTENGFGVTENGTLTTGPNNLQHYPVLQSITFDRDEVIIAGSLTSANNTVYNLQFFANKLADESGYGEGQIYLGSATAETDDYGIASFSETFARSTSAEIFTATATDPDGNTSEFSKGIGGLESQILAENRFSFSVNELGVPNVLDNSDIDAVVASFKTWSDVETAIIDFTPDEGITTSEKYAGKDEINLVTFADDLYDIPTGVLAIAAKTWQVVESTNTTEIIDVDIVFNPEFVKDPTYNLGVEQGTYDGYFDIQSVTTHEIGHVLGLLHSGLINSTMWFQIGEGTSVRDLTQDDKSWASYRYPMETYNSTFGSISGNITYGYDDQSVAGALVLAINTATEDTVHAYSDADGYYLVPGLIAGNYKIFIEPLDGDVRGRELWPGNISAYIGNNTIYLDYPGEFYNDDDADVESDDDFDLVGVSAGLTESGNDIITNLDKTHPTVELVKPTLTSGDLVNVLSNFNIRFSEPVDMETLTGTTCYLSSEGTTETVTGNITKPYSEYPSTVLFDPATDLEHNETYTLHLTTGIMDMRENNLENEYTQVFNTVPLDETAPSINEVIPADDSINVFISSSVKLIFSEPMNMSSVEDGFALTWTEEGTTNTVEGSFSWQDYNKLVIFTPSGYLKEGTVYTISVSDAATDLSANTMESSRSFNFTTVAEAPPEILYIGPSGEDITINTPVVVDFSEPVNTSSVNSTTFKLLLGLDPSSTAEPIVGTYEFFNENSTVVFRPLADLTEFTDYTIILTDGITDVSQPSSSLANTETTFKTADKVTEPSILYLDLTYGVAGNAVTIAGAGFDPNPAMNKVLFNGIEAVITKAYLTSLEVVVPAEALSGPVTVTVNNKTSNSRNFDIYTEILDPAGYATANAPIGTKSTHDSDVTPEGAFAYVTNPEEGTVSVVDMNTLEVETIMIGDGKYPLMIDINPEGTKAYVTNFYSSDVSVIDLEPGVNYNTVIKNIPVGIGPYGVAVTPDGQRVYVANYYSGSLSMIDADPTSGGYDHATVNIPIGKNPTVTKPNPDGALVLVVGDFGLTIVNSDPSNKDEYNTATANITIGKKITGTTPTPDGAFAIASTDDGYLLLIDLYPESGDYSDAVVVNVKAGCAPSDIKVRGDNAYVYLTDTDGDRILVYKIGVGGTGSSGSSIPSGLGMTLVYETEIPVGDAPQSLVIDADRLYVVDGDPSEPEVRRVTVIQFGLLSLSNGFSDLIKAIQGMIDAGDIKPTNGKNIIRKLEDAQKYIDAGKTRNALNSLNAAGNMIKALMNSRQITADQGNYLLNLLNLIIAEIDISKKSGEIDYYYGDLEQPVLDLIAETKLGTIYPNPSKEAVTVSYEIAENEMGSEMVTIQIYDVIGRLVSNLVNENLAPGRYTATWNGNFDNGEMASRGYYFIRLSAGKSQEVKQIMLIR